MTARRPPLSGRDVLLWALPESQWQQQVIDWASRAGWTHYHTRDSRKSPAGFPDLVLVKPGRMVVFAECKTMRGIELPSQKRWRALLNAAVGCQAYLWRPSDEDEVKEVLGLHVAGTFDWLAGREHHPQQPLSV